MNEHGPVLRKRRSASVLSHTLLGLAATALLLVAAVGYLLRFHFGRALEGSGERVSGPGAFLMEVSSWLLIGGPLAVAALLGLKERLIRQRVVTACINGAVLLLASALMAGMFLAFYGHIFAILEEMEQAT